ncbi:MAG: NAD(P)/FAD-dependent oxidoreductase [Actinomycetota bacterium]|nr:NAD(P)/FAD-dependent oxidoreductase [Actinomycetota bacterium]
MTTIDKDALKARYRAERDKRLRADGNEQYLELKDQLAHYLDDPYTERVEREPLHDHVTFTFVGGGFAGLVTGARLKEAGVDDVRILEKGGDFGGTWYWNRYPGAQCDTASMVYMPLLEECGHMPTEKYAHAPEILEHCQRIGKHFGLYEGALFHTQVTDLEWDDAASRWIVRTDRGDEFTSQFIGMGTGPLHLPKLPGIEGIESFQGHSFHTSRWDYAYTGGDPSGAPMEGLADKRVALIGTGATSVQCVPHLAPACGELFVFQRTPSSVDERNNHPIDPDWFAEIATPGWQQRWIENFTANQTATFIDEDLVQDGWTEITRRMKDKFLSLPAEEITPEKVMAALEDADFEKMEQIRARVETIVEDPNTAERLKAWYRQLCKRPCFHDEYLAAFNHPTAHLVDTDGKGVERTTERGVVVDGVEYEVDCIIYASGFEVGTPQERRAGFDVVGRDGVKLSERWGDGMRTMHGMHVHGFPNAFHVQATQAAALISNYPHNLTEAGRTIASVVSHALEQGHERVEVTQEAEDAWIDVLLTGEGSGLASVFGSAECTPGYYNNEGMPAGPGARLWLGYPGGPVAFFDLIARWRTDGRFDGLAFA